MNDNNKSKKIGIMCGQIVGMVLTACICAIAVALTYKLVLWII